MSEFIYLYRGGDTASAPEGPEAHMQRWRSWLEGLGAQGHLKDFGQPLEPTGKLVAGKSKTVTDGPFAEAKDLIGGFSLIEATDVDQAAQLALGCPIFDTGGAVEVRPVMKM